MTTASTPFLRPAPRLAWQHLLLAASLVAFGGLFLLTLLSGDTERAVGLVVGAVLFGVTAVALTVLTRGEGRSVRSLLLSAYAVKQAGALVRLFFVADLYGGVADAGRYHNAGEAIAQRLWSGDFGVIWLDVGTKFVENLTGLVYSVTTPSLLGGYFVFSTMSFWGLYLLWRAARLAVPELDRSRYTILLLFLPSLVFWPSSIGKEAWMVLCLGLAANGAARVFTKQPGMVRLAVGLAGATVVRAHVGLLLFLAVGGGMLFARPAPGDRPNLVRRLTLAAVVVVGGAIAANQVAGFFGIEITAEGIQQALFATEERTSMGGSEFSGVNPLNLPAAFLTVLFRPLPFEAPNFQAALAGVEGLLLLVLSVLSVRRLVAAGRMSLRNPYVATAAFFTVGFVLAFASFSNFGLLARQRTQVLPFFLLLLSVSPSGPRPEDSGSPGPSAHSMDHGFGGGRDRRRPSARPFR